MDRILRRVWFFDIHPPLGKLILAFGSALLGYKADANFVIEKIGMLYPENVKYVIPRIISASFSSATVPLTYLVSRRLGITRTSSIVASMMVATDFLGIIEGRLILMDSQLLAFCQIALVCALELWRTSPNDHRRHFAWLTATGVMAGVALSIKHTALATPGLIAVVSFFGCHFLTQPLELWHCAYAALVGIAVYVLPFYIMFQQLIYSGGKYDNFMQNEFKQTLIGNEIYSPKVKRQPFWYLFTYLNTRMISSNAGIKKRHSWESTYYQWVVNWRGVLYYVKSHDDGTTERIYLFGNPVVLWYVLFVVVSFTLAAIVAARYRAQLFQGKQGAKLQRSMITCTFLLSGWLCNLLPYMLVDRAAFIYHYIPGLFYGQLLAAATLDLLPNRPKSVLSILLACCMLAALVYWAPWVYSLPISRDALRQRRWLPRWT